MPLTILAPIGVNLNVPVADGVKVIMLIHVVPIGTIKVTTLKVISNAYKPEQAECKKHIFYCVRQRTE